MGQVGFKAATIVVALDNREIVAGTTLSGKIYLNIHKDVSDFTSVHITICGSELSKITKKGMTRNDASKQKYKAASEFNFLNAAYPLCEIDGTMGKGNYEFPFQCRIPKDVPCSMSCTNSKNDHCEIRYFVDARLHRKGFLKWNVSHQCDFVVVSAPMMHPPSNTYIGPGSTPITTLSCFKWGSIICGANLSQNIFTPNAIIAAHHIVLNRSTAQIYRIVMTFLEKVHWKARHRNGRPRESDFVRVLFKHEVNTSSLSDEDRTFATPLSTRPRDGQILDEDVMFSNFQNMIQSKIREGGNGLWSLRVPADIRETCSGRLITVSHILRLECITPFGCNNAVVLKAIPVHRLVLLESTAIYIMCSCVSTGQVPCATADAYEMVKCIGTR